MFCHLFSPKHNLTLPLMKDEEINNVVNAWQDLYGNLLQESNQGIAPINIYKFLKIKVQQWDVPTLILMVKLGV